MIKDRATEDYLEAIFHLSKKGRVTVSKLSEILGISKSAVSQMLNKLKEEELIKQPYYGSVKLTEKGLKRGRKVADTHNLLVNFLLHLGVDNETAEKDACLMEHSLHEETLNKILTHINNNG